MNAKKIIITDNQTLINFVSEYNSKGYIVTDYANFSFFLNENVKIALVYVEEDTLSEHPELFGMLDSLNPLPEIIIDSAVNIIQKIMKRKKYLSIDEIPFKIEEIIFDFLHDCMIKDNHRGYTYLKQAFLILYLDSTAAFNIRKCIYLPIQAKADASEDTVERCIRYAIKEGFKSSKATLQDNLFKNFSSIPSNKSFIEASIQYIRMNYPDFAESCVL